MIINTTRYRLPPGQFFDTATKKRAICMHFTAGGTAEGAFAEWLRDPGRVGTAYIIDRDPQATVYQAFDSQFWAYHLGENTTVQSDDVGIEICNYGPLKLISGKLFASPGNWTKWIGAEADRDRYVKLDKPWRGFEYWHAFTRAQIDVARELVAKVCAEHSIPRVLLPPELRYVLCVPQLRSHSGIFAHHNAVSWKFDTGPAFPLEELIK